MLSSLTVRSFSPSRLISSIPVVDCSISLAVSLVRLVMPSRSASRSGLFFHLIIGASRSLYPVVSLLARIVLVRLVGRLVPHLILSSRLACSFRSSHLRFPLRRLVLFRAAIFPSRHIVLPWRLAYPSCFFFIRLIALRICDEAFLRGQRLPYHPDGRAARSLIACPSRWRWRYPLPGPCYPVMRR